MHIDIAGRFRPFSHLPGTQFVLPCSSIVIQAFPTRLVLKDAALPHLGMVGAIAFDIKGPVEEFTVMQDLEKMQLRIWGKGSEEFFRYRVERSLCKNGVDIVVEKGSIVPDALLGRCMPAGEATESRYCVSLGENNGDRFVANMQLERLSFGGHKSQNVDMLRLRPDFFEILPLWHRLGQVVPPAKEPTADGTLLLLQQAAAAIPQTPPEHLLKIFNNLFIAGFDNWLTPRLADTDYHGLVFGPANGAISSSALPLLTRAAALIRSLLLQQSDTVIKLLPALPVELHCGRFIDATCGELGLISMEWSKKAVRRATLRALKTERVAIVCAKGEQTCRLRLGNKDRGVTYQIGAPLDIVAGQNYWFDNFHR